MINFAHTGCSSNPSNYLIGAKLLAELTNRARQLNGRKPSTEQIARTRRCLGFEPHDARLGQSIYETKTMHTTSSICLLARSLAAHLMNSSNPPN